MCESVDEQIRKEYLQYNLISELDTFLNGSDAIKDINPEFIEDMKIILEKIEDNLYVTALVLDIVSEYLSLNC